MTAARMCVVDDTGESVCEGFLVPPDGGGGSPGGEWEHGYEATDTNTGYKGLGLTAGDLTSVPTQATTAHGQVFENLHVSGKIHVEHNNVLIRGCHIEAPLGTSPVDVRGSVSGLTVEWTEINQGLEGQGGDRNGISPNLNSVPAGAPRCVVFRCHIHHCGDGAKGESGWRYVENLIESGDVQYIAPNGTPHHADGIQCQKLPATHTPALEIIRNKIVGGTTGFGTANIYFNTINGDVHDILIDSNDLWHAAKAIALLGAHQSNTGQFLGTSVITDNWIRIDWILPGDPEMRLGLEEPCGTVIHTGNRLVDVAGVDQGSAD